MRSHGEKGTNPSLLCGHQSHNSLRELAKLWALKHACAWCTCWMKIPSPMSWRRHEINCRLSFRRLCQQNKSVALACFQSSGSSGFFSATMCAPAEITLLLHGGVNRWFWMLQKSSGGTSKQGSATINNTSKKMWFSLTKKITSLAKLETWITFDSTESRGRGEDDLYPSQHFTVEILIN